MFRHSAPESSDFLPNLTNAFKSLDVDKPLSTREFVEACAKVEPIFDHIGALLYEFGLTVFLCCSFYAIKRSYQGGASPRRRRFPHCQARVRNEGMHCPSPVERTVKAALNWH